MANGDTISIPGSWSVGVKLQTGFLIAHRPSLMYLQQDKIKSIEVSYLKSSNGIPEWQQNYNSPLYGFAYQFFDLGNREYLGNGHALYSLVVFPLLHENHLRLNIRFGVGIGYIEKRYTINELYKNQAISTHINGTITTGLQLRIPCNSKTQISTGIDFTHFSNGAARLPNAGLNIATVNLGVQHFFGGQINIYRRILEPYNKSKEITFYVATGFKDQNYGATPKISIGVLEGDLHYRISRKSLLGGGADLFYDATLQKRIYDLEGDSLNKLKANFRAGLHVSYGLIVGNFRGYYQMGYYLYNKLPMDVSIYNRLSLRYFINPHLFVCFNLKSHFAKADYFEYGVGYKI